MSINSDRNRLGDLAHRPMFDHPPPIVASGVRRKAAHASSRAPIGSAAALATRVSFLYAFPMSTLGKPRQLETEAQLYDAAIKILMRRAHSVSEMKKALARRSEDEKLVRNVVERLKRENLIDDARYAKQFVRFRAESRKQGQFRIARDLRARGVPDRHIETALKEAA